MIRSKKNSKHSKHTRAEGGGGAQRAALRFLWSEKAVRMSTLYLRSCSGRIARSCCVAAGCSRSTCPTISAQVAVASASSKNFAPTQFPRSTRVL